MENIRNGTADIQRGGGKMKDKELKNWDVSFVSYRSENIQAKTKEEAWKIAKGHQEIGERLGVIEETDEEANEE